MGRFTCWGETHHLERRQASTVEGYRTPRRVATPNGLWQNGGRGGRKGQWRRQRPYFSVNPVNPG